MHGISKNCHSGNLAIWQSGNLAIWQSGNLAIWQSGNLAILTRTFIG
ncbi:hypothetical protein AB97_0498 [Escherichia coli 1-110-08_S3_C1]|nr:hypothetical protein AC55_0640 [Escherichia coli 1-110-08_S3_C3]EYE29714.1 hypothetical protein AC25_0207 [Escherichia coli 1-110-08_S3_C2]EYE30369.1 hypothetical protein AB97_0498 [Escherichia coli 1-110-08_S3_C1]